MYWLLTESMRFHTDIIALQRWIQCSVGVGSVITTSVSNKCCTYIEFHSAGTPFPHRQAKTTEGWPLDSDDNHKKDWRKHCKQWNWALAHPQLSIMALFYTPVTVFLQAASDFSFSLPPFFFSHLVFWKTNTVNGNLNAVRPQFVSTESVGLWRNKWEISAPHPRLRTEKHNLALWYLLCSMLQRHASFASRLQNKTSQPRGHSPLDRGHPADQTFRPMVPIRYDLHNSMTDTVTHSK